MIPLDPTLFPKAADKIRRGGLSKTSFRDTDGSHCILGALGHHLHEQDMRGEIRLLTDMIGVEPGSTDRDRIRRLIAWNGAPERTAQDVITLLEQAEEKVKAEGSGL